MPKLVINPLTSRPDYVGDSGGGGSVTSVGGGVGWTPTPDPIVGAGVGNLDIDDLTAETLLAAGDLFPFVDVSGGGSAIANQRKITFSNLAAGIAAALSGTFQPLDAGLTALASLGAGIAISDGADGWFARSVAVTDTATVNLTVTNANGVAGNPTIQADVLAAGISGLGFVDGTGAATRVAFWLDTDTISSDAGMVYDSTNDVLSVAGQIVAGTVAGPTNATAGIELNSTTKAMLLSRMTTAQKNALAGVVPGMMVFDSTLQQIQFSETAGTFRTMLALEGRTGTTNNPVISSTSGGRITGGVLGNLELVSQLLGPQSGFIDVQNRLLADTVIPSELSGTYNHVEIGPAVSFGAGNLNLRILHYDPFIDLSSIGDNLTAVTMFRFQPQYRGTAGVTNDLGIHSASLMGPTFTPGAGGTMTGYVGRGLRYEPVFSNTGTGNTITSSYATNSSGTLSAAWTVTGTWALGRIVDPGAAASIARLGAIEVEDLTHGTVNFSLWSKGSAVFLAHGGPALFCADQSTITAPATSAGIELRSVTKALLISSMTTTQKNALTVADGMVVYDTTRAKWNFRENGFWAEYQLNDADLTEIAAVANVRGDILITNSTPAWTRLAVGGASTLLKSDGTDPSWGTVNLLSAFHGDTAAGTVVRGDIIRGNSTPAWSRLAIGAAGTVLTSDGTDASWAAPTAPVVATDLVTGSTSTIPNGSNLTANTVTATPGSGTEVHITGSVCWDKTGATNKNVVMKLFKDGTEIDTNDRYQHFNLAGSAATSQTTQTAHWVIASEASGSHTYTLRLEELAGTANNARRLVSRLSIIY